MAQVFAGRLNTINKDEIHLWLAYSDEISAPDLLSRYREILSTDECARMQAMGAAPARHQYLLSRVLARTVLSNYMQDRTPGDMRFAKNEYGKPYIANAPEYEYLQFNIAHTRGMIVMAVSVFDQIGVDVECTRRKVDIINLAKRYFSMIEFEDLLRLPEEQQRARFFDIWTLKEAYLKACGKGMSMPLNRVTCTFSSDNSIEIDLPPDSGDLARQWGLLQIQSDDSRRLTIVIDGCLGKPRSIELLARKIVPLADTSAVHYPVLRYSGNISLKHPTTCPA